MYKLPERRGGGGGGGELGQPPKKNLFFQMRSSLIDCWGTVVRQVEDTDGDGGQGGATNYVVSARLQRRTQLSGKLSNVVQLYFEALNRLRARGFGRVSAAEILRDQERRRSTWRR